jgi:hypothetical protein
MASTELAVVRDNGTAPAERDVVDGWVAMASDVFKLAAHICDTDFVPKNYRGNAPATAAAILAGRELGIGPMTSLRHVQLVEGSPSLSAEYKRARVLSAGHEFDILDLSTTRCRVAGRRRGSTKPPLEVTFTIEDAQRAGLIKPRGAWVTRPRRMLFARAGTELCDFLFADATNGLATTELLDGDTGEDELAGYDEPDGAKAAAPAARTARRKTPAAGDDTRSRSRSAEPAQDGAAGDRTARDAIPRAAGAAPSRGAQPSPPQDPGLPPLPGEDEPPDPTAGPPQATASPLSTSAAGPEQSDRHRKLVGIVHAHFRRLGYTSDEDELRITHTAKLAGAAGIGSTNDLDEDELSTVADTLARCRDRGRLVSLLMAGEKPDGGDGDG